MSGFLLQGTRFLNILELFEAQYQFLYIGELGSGKVGRYFDYIDKGILIPEDDVANLANRLNFVNIDQTAVIDFTFMVLFMKTVLPKVNLRHTPDKKKELFLKEFGQIKSIRKVKQNEKLEPRVKLKVAIGNRNFKFQSEEVQQLVVDALLQLIEKYEFPKIIGKSYTDKELKKLVEQNYEILNFKSYSTSYKSVSTTDLSKSFAKSIRIYLENSPYFGLNRDEGEESEEKKKSKLCINENNALMIIGHLLAAAKLLLSEENFKSNKARYSYRSYNEYLKKNVSIFLNRK